MPMKAAIYARVSTEDQAEGRTIEIQLDYARRYLELHDEFSVYKYYSDAGVSGALPMEERPEGAKLLADARNHKFDLVLVYRVDRLARDTRHLLNTFHELDQLGIALRSMTEPFDTSNPTGRFLMTMLASVAALERDTIVERMTLGKDRQVRAGRWPGGTLPYGYRLDEQSRLEIDPEEAEIVRTIFRLYTQDRLYTVAIADYLNARQVPTPYQAKGIKVAVRGKWDAGRISRMLRNETYIGQYVYGKETKKRRELITVQVPAIIDRDTWDHAQRLLRRNFTLAQRNSKRLYLLKGLIRCGICGRTYVGDGNLKKNRYYYRCTGNSSFRGQSLPKCGAKGIRAELLEEIIWQDILGFIANPTEVLDRLKEKLKEELERRRPLESELATLEKAIREKQGERERTISLFRRSLITEQEAERELLLTEKEMETLLQRREALFAQKAGTQELENRVLSTQGLLEELQKRAEGEVSWDIKRELVEALVANITIHTILERGKKVPQVHITYCFDRENSDRTVHVSTWTNPAKGSRPARVMADQIWEYSMPYP